MEKELEFLREQGVDSGLIDGVEEFRAKYDVAEEAKGRVICPDMPFYGREVGEWESLLFWRGEPAFDRPQSYRKKYAGGKSGLDFRTSGVQCFFPCKYQ